MLRRNANVQDNNIPEDNPKRSEEMQSITTKCVQSKSSSILLDYIIPNQKD